MKVAGVLLIVLIFIMSVPHPDSASATDAVQITGYVHDVEGNPVKDVYVEVFSLTPPWISYGRRSTDAKGYYAFSLERPRRIEPPEFPPFYKGRPVYEGYRLHAGWPVVEGRWTVILDHDIVINTEGRSAIQKDLMMEHAGVIKLRAYHANGTAITTFMPLGGFSDWREDPMYPAYTTDLNWRTFRSAFIHDYGLFLVRLNTPIVLNLPWYVPGFGKLILRADNNGQGFVFTKPGETITINLNCELAKTECRLLTDSYMRYLNEGYKFSKDLPIDIRSAGELLEKATQATNEIQKARFADLCLNKTLWTAESLEYERALQDIEKHRKGNVTLHIVDENGEPLTNADVTVTQVSHDFLFGTAEGPCPFDLYAYELLAKAGINYGLLSLFWENTEPSLGQYSLDQHPVHIVEHLKNMGIRIGGEGLICLEPGFPTWGTGLLNLSFEELREKIYEHVYKIVSTYSDYIDYWIVIHNPHLENGNLGFAREQIVELIKSGVKAIRDADPTSQVLVFFDHPCGFLAGTSYQGTDDNFTADPYTFFSYLNEHDIDHDGIALWVTYGSVWESPPGPVYTEYAGERAPYPFRDLASISCILDWYCTLSVPVHITGVDAPGNYTSPLGYWHRRNWDEKLKVEWIEKFYTIAYSKPFMKEITYAFFRDESFMKVEAGLLSISYAPKESFYALKRLITENWTTRLRMKTDANGQIGFKGFAGDYNITVSTKNFTGNFTIHVNERASDTYTINLGRAKAERAGGQAKEAVSKAKAEGRTINLERAEKLLEDARRALIDENYTQAILLAEEANRAAQSAVTWLVIPATIAFAGSVLSGSVILFRRVRAKRRKETP